MSVITRGARAVILTTVFAVLTLVCPGEFVRETVAESSPERPNIIFILTDDQMSSTIQRMPAVGRMQQQGVTFSNMVNVYPLCCPSRATIQRGQYAHNHHITNNGLPNGGYEKFAADGLHRSTVATWVNAQGYTTLYFGKYMNGLPPDVESVPGWDKFRATATVQGGQKISGTDVVVSKEEVDPEIADRARTYLNKPHDRPFMMFVSFDSPHYPYHHSDRYDTEFQGVRHPRTPDFNEEDVSDKPSWVAEQPKFGDREVNQLDEEYRESLRSLIVVDNFIGSTIRALEATGELNSTYIFFYTDNGVHNGSHRLTYGKKTAYQTDIGFPLIAMGPGLSPGTNEQRLVGSHDIAPTLARLAGAEPAPFVDGRSIMPLFPGDPNTSWRTAVYSQNATGVTKSSVYDKLVPEWRAMRTRDETYVEWANGERELYLLPDDPYQVANLYGQSPDRESALHARLEALSACAAETCRAAEN